MKFRKMIMLVALLIGTVTWGKAEQPTDESPLIINSEQRLGECLTSVQWQYFPVSLPSLSERLLQPAGSFPVDWDSFSTENRQKFRGWIDGDGIVRYAVGLYEDYWTGEIVVLDDSGGELFRISREKGYDPYDYQRALFDLGKKEVLSDEFTRMIFHPSKIATVVELVPLVFWEAHLQVEQELAVQELSAVPMMMMSMSSGGVTKPMASMSMDTNELVILDVSLPETFGVHLEIFLKDDLIYDSSWEVGDGADWISTYGGTNIFWTDPSSSNQSTRFYMLSDADIDTDGDGFSDLREAYISGTESNIFNWINGDGDDMHDWYELLMFGNLNQVGTGDFDGDGLLNNEEMVFVSGAVTNITVHSDPSLSDTDADGLDDNDELLGTPPTDPWNNDVSAPVATMIWPTNNFVMIP